MNNKTVLGVIAVVGLLAAISIAVQLAFPARPAAAKGSSPDAADRETRKEVYLGSSGRFVAKAGMPKRLLVTKGLGNATYDLRDVADGSDVRIELGVGDATVILPKDAGVRVYGRHDGLGTWVTPGFSKDGDYFVNARYGKAERNVDLMLFRGYGTATLVQSGEAAAR